MRGTNVYATAIRTAVLGLLLSAGLVFAQAPKKKKEETQPPPKPIITKAPKTCAEQCEFIDKICSSPCDDIKDNANAKASCKADCGQMAAVCEGSCKEKGKVDAQYMMEHIKPPKPPPGVKVRMDDDH